MSRTVLAESTFLIYNIKKWSSNMQQVAQRTKNHIQCVVTIVNNCHVRIIIIYKTAY